MKMPLTYCETWGLIKDANREEVAACHSNKQDASNIVRICNVHDDLVRVSQDALTHSQLLGSGQQSFISNSELCERLGAALTKAKGGA